MKLYRGENIDNWQKIKSDGFITPKSTSFEIQFTFDGSITFDGSATYGNSWQNAVNGHQIDSKKFCTSGISTTPKYERAKHYALHDNFYIQGVILELDSLDLDLDIYEVIVVSEKIRNPQIILDNEIIIRRFDNQSFPIELFTIHEIKSSNIHKN